MKIDIFKILKQNLRGKMIAKILIIGEDKLYIRAFCTQLAELGYGEKNIWVFPSVNAAVSMAVAGISVIFTDMSNENHCAKRFRSLENHYKDIPIIILSPAEGLDATLNLINNGANDYLLKEDMDIKALDKALKLVANKKRKVINDGNKKLIDIIKEQKKQLEDILGSINDVVWQRRADDFSLIYINNACKDVYGYTPDEMLSEHGKTLEHIHPDDREKLNNKIKRTLRDGHGGIEYRIIDRNGQVKHIYGHSSIQYKDGKPFVYNGVSVDITGIRNAEHALQEKMQEIEELYESITERFFSMDSNWMVTYVNKQFEIFYSRGKKDIIGKSVFEIFPKLKESPFYDHLKRALEEKVVIHTDGPSPTWNMYIAVDAYPTKDGIAVFIKDITEQKELQDKVLNEEQKLRAIINNTRDIIWYVDKDQNIISGNQAFYDRIAVMTNNKDYSEVTNNDFKEAEVIKWNAFFARALAGEHFKVIEENVVNNKKVFEEISFNPIPDKDNNIVGISCFSRDITEEKTLQDQIFKEQQNLKALINNTSDFIWSVDTNLNIVSINEPFVDFISGLSNRVLKPGDYIAFSDFGEDLKKMWLDAYAKALSGKRVKFDDEATINGTTFYTEKSLNPIFDSTGEIVGVSCFARDKSEEVKLRKQIQKDEQSLRATINNTRDHIWSVDKDLNIIFLNQSAKEFVFNITGQTLGAGDFVLPEGFSQAFIDTRLAHYRKALTGLAFSIVDELYDNDEISYMETAFNPIRDFDGNVIGVNCYSRDITAQKKHLARIELQNAKLKEIAWIQSHKVRGPVSSILGLTNLFNYEDSTDNINHEIILRIQTATMHLDEIVKEVVSMTEDMGTNIE